MSVQTEIDRISQNVANTYAVLEALGAELPEEQNSDNLSTTAGSAKALLYSEQSLTDDQKAQARTNIGAVSEDDIPQEAFVATYGTTTSAEVEEAYQAGKAVTCIGSISLGYEETATEMTRNGLASTLDYTEVIRLTATQDLENGYWVVTGYAHSYLTSLRAGQLFVFGNTYTMTGDTVSEKTLYRFVDCYYSDVNGYERATVYFESVGFQEQIGDVSAWLVSRDSATRHVFSSMMGEAHKTITLSEDAWSYSEVNLQTTTNKTTSITSSSTDTTYPSAKAVYTAIEDAKTTLNETIEANKFSGSYNDLTDKPNITDDGSGEVIVEDEEHNAILLVNEDGLETTALTLTSPGGKRFRITVDDSGALTTTEVTT